MTNMNQVASQPGFGTSPHHGGMDLGQVPPKMTVRDLNFYYGEFHALKKIELDVPEKKVTAIIGPSGCGKATLLRIFNRIYAIYPKLTAKGEVILDGENVLDARYPLNR